MTTRKPPSPSPSPSQPSPQPPKPPNVAAMQARLRKETIALLGLKASKLDPGDEILIARAGCLRLLVADLEAAALHGDKISVGPYVEASAELERIVRNAHHVAVNADGAPEALASARRKMAELMGIVLNETPDEAEQRRQAELDGLHKRIAELEALLAERPLPAATPSPPRSETPQPSPAPDNVVPLRDAGYSPVVTSGARDFIDSINRRAW